MSGERVLVLAIWFQAFLIWITNQSPWVPALAMFISGIKLLLPQRLIIRGATIMLGLGLAAVFVVDAMATQYPSEVVEVLVPSWFTSIFAKAMLLGQVLLLYRLQPQVELPWYVTPLVLLTLLCAFNHGFVAAEQSLHLTLAIVSVGVIAAVSQASRRLFGSVPTSSLSRQLTILAVLVCVAISTVAVARGWSATINNVQALLPGWMAQSAAGANRAARGYVRNGGLRSITSEKRTDPMHVAFRVYAEKAPGYMRGRVFESYRRSQWRQVSRRRGKWNRLNDKKILTPRSQAPPGIDNLDRGYELFAVDTQAQPPYTRVEIHNDPKRNEMFFLPLETAYLSGRGTYLATDEHGIVFTGITTSVPYVAYVAKKGKSWALSEGLRERLLEPPAQLDESVLRIAAEVCAEATSTRQKIDAVASYFQDGFEYSVEAMEFPANVEPLSYFLVNQPPAHCEFFASGAVTLLRLEGVPARYVTGYVVTELESEYGDYWLARNRNAHAWAEAYDERRKKWIVVEATPGMSIPGDDGFVANITTAAIPDSQILGDLSDPSAWRPDRWLRQSWIWTQRWLRYPAIIAGILLGCTFLYRRWMPREAYRWGSPHASRYRRLRHRLDRRLLRRQLRRSRGETLHQFANRIENTDTQDPCLAACAGWYRSYANTIYNGRPPSQELGELPRVRKWRLHRSEAPSRSPHQKGKTFSTASDHGPGPHTTRIKASGVDED